MKAKVLKRFKDRHSGEIHEAGKTMIISRERFDEILSVGAFVEEVKETKKAKPATK